MKKTPARKTARKNQARKVPASQPSSALGLSKILVPIDFSPYSKKAFRYAIPLARQFGASLHLVYVVEPTVYPADLGFGQVVYPSFEDELIQKGKGELEKLIREEIGNSAKATATVRTGKPHQEILQEATDRRVDMIVMATHGHTGVEHILFGSTAERIVRNAQCPVLTIRPD